MGAVGKGADIKKLREQREKARREQVKMQEQEKEGMVDILKEKVFFSDSN